MEKLNYVLFTLLFVFYQLYYIVPGAFSKFVIAVQGLLLLFCLLIGLFSIKKAFFACGPLILFPVYLYLVLTLISSIISFYPFYSFIQSVMLCAVVTFTLGCGNYLVNNYSSKIFYIPIFLESLVIVMSVFSFLVFGSSVTIEGGVTRLHGFVGESATLSMICALNICLVFFVIKNKAIKWMLIIVSFYCLLLTGSRGALIALIATAVCGYCLYYGSWKKSLLILAGIGMVISFFYVGFLTFRGQYIRNESLLNLSGRTTMWSVAIPAAIKKPLGFGYCLGGLAMADPRAQSVNMSVDKTQTLSTLLTPPKNATATLHNGYVQALGDSGLLGFIVYLSVYIQGVYFIVKTQSDKKIVLFSCIFILFSIGNFVESIFFSPRTSIALTMWLAWSVLLFSFVKLKRQHHGIKQI